MNSLKMINNAKAVNIPKTIFKPFDILGNFIVKSIISYLDMLSKL
jgi:hypothetical protein